MIGLWFLEVGRVSVFQLFTAVNSIEQALTTRNDKAFAKDAGPKVLTHKRRRKLWRIQLMGGHIPVIRRLTFFIDVDSCCLSILLLQTRKVISVGLFHKNEELQFNTEIVQN